MLKQAFAPLALAALLVAGSAGAAPITLTFDDVGLVHGSVVNTQYSGVTISAINTGGGPNLAVAFDSNLSGTRDDDLEFDTGWSTGNLAPDTRLGNLLIIQENPNGCQDGICDAPDDEGSRPAGTLIFDFDVAVTSFGLDLVDVESLSQEDGSIVFFDGASSVTIDMSTFLAGLILGNHSANRVDPFQLADLPGLSQITRVELNLNGSGGVDNVTFEPVPEPSTAALLALGVVALGARARSRRS
jgi:hypothetical protein